MPARYRVVLTNGAALTSGLIPVATTNGRLSDSSISATGSTLSLTSVIFGSTALATDNASNVASGSAVSISTATPTNLGSITLTAGRWLIFGMVNFVTTGATTLDFKAGSSSTSATFGADNQNANMPTIASALSDTVSVVIPTRFLDNRTVGGTTTVFLIGSRNFQHWNRDGVRAHPKP